MAIINNLGYMWHRKYVNWYSGSELIGVCEYPPDKEGKPVNFADQAGIYVLYDKNFKCVYVGQAGGGRTQGLYHRLKEHAINDYLFCRWERFSWFGFGSVKGLEKEVNTNVNELMDFIESLIIFIVEPDLNMDRGFLAGDKSGVKWFYQEAEYDEQKAEYEKLKKICKSI